MNGTFRGLMRMLHLIAPRLNHAVVWGWSDGEDSVIALEKALQVLRIPYPLPGGTAFLCDAGFTGPHESVLGRDITAIIQRFVTSMPQRFEVAKGRCLLQGALVDIDPSNGRAIAIKRISESVSSPADP